MELLIILLIVAGVIGYIAPGIGPYLVGFLIGKVVLKWIPNLFTFVFKTAKGTILRLVPKK